MTRNLKALGLALLAVLALGAVAAQGAWGADEHEFHSNDESTILTGGIPLFGGPHKISIGEAGTVECSRVTFESTSSGNLVSAGTYKTDTITVKPTYENCTFGGQPATVKFNHCAYVFDTETTSGNTTGDRHATLEIECAKGHKIELHTVNCTVTIGAQVVADSVRYQNETTSSITTNITAHNIVVGKERNTASQPAIGCLVFPTGAVAKYVGTVTAECREDDGFPQIFPTTPSGTIDGFTADCSVTGA